MNIKQGFNIMMNKKIQIIIGLFLILLAFSIPVKAENIIYDNITSSNYKYLMLDEINYFGLLSDYKYDVLLNGSFIGSYEINEKIFIPDNSNITVVIPSPIKTTTDDIWNTSIKPQLFTFIGFLLSWGFGLIIVFSVIGYVIYRLDRKRRKGY